MIEPKMYFPEVTINKMNAPFTIKLAVTRNDDVIDHILNTTGELIAEDLDEIDDKFSPFKSDSLVSKFHRGDSERFFQDEMFQIVYNQCAIAKIATGERFDAFKDKMFDPTGILKGWAVETEFQKNLKPLLVDPAIVGVCFRTGEGMQLASKAGSHFDWNVGIKRPNNSHGIIADYRIQNGAIATAVMDDQEIQTDIHPENNFVKQMTVLSKGLTEAAVLAKASLKDNTVDVENWIDKSRLSGLLINENGKLSVFEQGQFDNVVQAQM
ncbi:hypothetical protein [Companilactobacillus mishanensis]|uniref:FAD:protein FMN transferase n=1 Tax=Companilactobacillus mishanensis TaxID=2486008 RepID=A0ABW9P7M5_9LACO|nr:hypothetical protein [Companilactobacillus mishanensis]MQS45258.1 FAD:protein FMN transferase [Companilactobacillus mishanensis]